MPTDTQRLIQNKELILSTIQSRGPSLPVHIARATNLSILFASAFLSELYSEGKVKMSHLKVGSSSLYYLAGQEPQLENFIEHLNHKEKEAFFQLKNDKILEDTKLEPAIRVALRGIKDFAVPLTIKSDEESKLFWKHYLISDEEVKSLLSTKKKKEPIQEKIMTEKEEKKEEPKIIEQKIEKEAKQDILPSDSPVQDQKKVPKRKKTVEESKFVKNIKEHLLSRDIELMAIIEEGKKDFIAKIRTDDQFGKQEYYLIAKDKKKISSDDLTLGLHKAQLEKMPLLFMATGELDKKHLNYAKEWRNLIKFEKLRL